MALRLLADRDPVDSAVVLIGARAKAGRADVVNDGGGEARGRTDGADEHDRRGGERLLERDIAAQALLEYAGVDPEYTAIGGGQGEVVRLDGERGRRQAF